MTSKCVGFCQFERGLYIIRRDTRAGIGKHVAILAAGFYYTDLPELVWQETLIEFTETGLVFSELTDYGGWQYVRRIEPTPEVLRRLDQVVEAPLLYDLAISNCEHVATFIETGEWRSEQVRMFALVAVSAAFLVANAREHF